MIPGKIVLDSLVWDAFDNFVLVDIKLVFHLKNKQLPVLIQA